MNYIELINRFWASCEELGFRTTEIALYFYLLDTNNRRSWKQTFKIDNKVVESAIGISYGTLKTVRNKLKQAGFIDFKTKNGSPIVLYTLTKFDEVVVEVQTESPTLTNNVEVTVEVPVEVVNEVSVEVMPGNARTYINQTETKLETLSIISPEDCVSEPIINSAEIKKKLLADQLWQEHACRQSTLSISFLPMIPEQIDNFLSWILSTGAEKSVLTIEDAKRRFIYWWKYTGIKEWNNGNNRSNNQDGEGKSAGIKSITF